MKKVNLNYLKNKFNLKKFITRLNKDIKIGSSKKPDSYDFSWNSTASILLSTYDDIVIHDKLKLKMYMRHREGKLLTLQSNNFKIIKKIWLHAEHESNLLYCLSSKINKTFYLFIYHEPNDWLERSSNGFAFFKSKKKVDAINKMTKIRDIIKKASDEGDCLKDAMLR